jgi:DNA-binding MarR family transcriptional regulator
MVMKFPRQHPAISSNIGFLLKKVGTASFDGFAARAAAYGLHPMHFGLLQLIASDGPVSQQELGARIGIDPSTMVARMDALEQRGLVQRRRSAEDRRAYEIDLTDAGRETLGALGKEAQAHARHFFRALSTEERRQLATLLAKLATTVDEDAAASH